MTPTANGKTDDTGTFCHQLQPTGHIHRQSRYLTDNSTKTVAAQTFLKTIQHTFFITALHYDQTVLRETGLRQCGHEKIRPGYAPENFTRHTRRNSCRKQSGCRPINSTIAASAHLVQTSHFQASTGQMVVYGRNSEWQIIMLARRALRDPLKPFPQFFHNKLFGAFMHD